jgi:hypothetical protein
MTKQCHTYETSARIITFWATDLTDAMRDAADWIAEHAERLSLTEGEHPGYDRYFVHAPVRTMAEPGTPVAGDKFGYAYNVSVTY